MKKIILIKYGELTTKKGHMKYFIDALYKNINYKLKKYKVKIVKENRRMFIECATKDIEIVSEKLKEIPGIFSFCICHKAENDLTNIKKEVITLLSKEKFATFKVETKRSNKKFQIDSIKMNQVVGSYILKQIPNLKVDVHRPDLLIVIEIRSLNTYIYINEIKGLAGYPVGILGKGLLMLSGGIDSPVAGYLALKRGLKIDCIYFESIPHTSIEARNKVLKLIKKLVNFTDTIELHIISFTKLQETIYKQVEPKYSITIMRRMMYRITELLAQKINCVAIINGENIGQVASQTLESIAVINEVVTMPVLRPVCCLDKLDIIQIAKKINTYDISILPYQDCCTLFIPEHPVTKPVLDKVVQMEKTFNYKKLIDECLQNKVTITITDIEEDNFKELL